METAVEFTGQQKFLTPLLANACRFLEEQRHKGAAWGEIHERPIGLYNAYLAVSALQATYPEGSDGAEALRHQIATIELSAKSVFGEKPETLDISGLTYFLSILRAQQEPDQDYIDRLAKYLAQLVKVLLEQPHRVRVREFVPALIALSNTRPGAGTSARRPLRAIISMRGYGLAGGG